MVARVWQRAGLQPHRMRRYMASDDPDFETKAADIIGLHLKPPAHAAVFSLDEKAAIQALDRLDPVLPLSPGRAERHGFEYFRHGTLSLYAALNTATGEVLGKTSARHTSAEFIAFLEELLATQPPHCQLHAIVDTSRLTKPRPFPPSWPNTRACASTPLRLIPPGSTRSKSGSPKSSAISSPVASLPPKPIWPEKSCATSGSTTKTPNPLSGLTAILLTASRQSRFK
jgi:hypothetical protein